MDALMKSNAEKLCPYLIWESRVYLLLQALHDFRVSCQIVGQEDEREGTGLVASKYKHCHLRNDLVISQTCTMARCTNNDGDMVSEI